MPAFSSIAAGVLGGALIGHSLKGGKKGGAPASPELAKTPDAEVEAEETAKRAAQARVKPKGSTDRSGTLLTNPTGIHTKAPTERKTLLGM